MKKVIIMVLVIGLVVGGGFLAWNKFFSKESSSANAPLSKEQLRPNMIMTVKRDSLEKVVSVGGTVEPVESQDLYFKTNGTIKSINIEEGAKVKKGQVLMELENDQQRLSYLKAKRNYEQAVIDGTQAQIKEAELDLKIAEDKLEETKLKAPFSGIINQISIEEGSYTAQDQDKTVAKLIDDTGYQVEVSINESDSRQLEVGQLARIRLDALSDKKFKGKVVDIAANAESNSGVVTLPVTVAITEKPEFIKPGFSAEVDIIVSQTEDKLVVPITALYNQQGQSKVVKLVNGEPTPTQVTTGISSGQQVVIKQGLQAGDKVLINSYLFANQGQSKQQDSGGGFPGGRMMRGGGR